MREFEDGRTWNSGSSRCEQARRALLACCTLLPFLFGSGSEEGEAKQSARDSSSVASDTLRELLLRLTSDDEDDRDAAERELGHLGPHAYPVFPELCKALQSKGPEIRRNILHVLGSIGGREAVPVLIRSLTEERDMAVRKAAAQGLQCSNPLPKEAIPALVKCVRDAVALGDDQIFLEEVPIAPRSRSQYLGPMCAYVLAKMRADAVPATRELLQSRIPGERFVAVEILRRIGPPSYPALHELAACLTDPDPDLRQNAARALGAIGPRAKPAVPALLKTLSDESWEPRLYAAIALKDIGAENEQANAALIRLTQDSDPGCRASALATIRDYPNEADKFVSAVIAALDDPNSGARAKAIEAVAAFGSSAKAGAPSLIKLLKSKEDFDRSGAADALGKIRDVAVGVPDLAAALKDSCQKVRLNAAGALGAYGRSARSALPALDEAAKELGEVGAAAKRALVQIRWGM
jgi:HEAT repeat protein